MQDDEIGSRQKPSSAALDAIRDMLMAPLPTYRHERTKAPLKSEKDIARRRAAAPKKDDLETQ